MTCISHVARVFAISRATVRAHASFLRFACVKRVSTCVCLHTRVKFKLGCTVCPYVCMYVVILLHVTHDMHEDNTALGVCGKPGMPEQPVSAGTAFL